MQKINFKNLPDTNTPINATNLNLMQDNIENAINSHDVIGAIQMYAGSTAPTGYMICDGSAVSRTTYSDLFDIIGTTYGAGDGSTTFNIPNLKGKVPVGLDSNDNAFDVLGETGGEKTHTLTVSEMAEHGHDLYGYYNSQAGGNSVDLNNATGNGITATYSPVQKTGGNQPHNNLQPYIVLNYIIKY